LPPAFNPDGFADRTALALQIVEKRSHSALAERRDGSKRRDTHARTIKPRSRQGIRPNHVPRRDPRSSSAAPTGSRSVHLNLREWTFVRLDFVTPDARYARVS
jgi:hypothetical protein